MHDELSRRRTPSTASYATDHMTGPTVWAGDQCEITVRLVGDTMPYPDRAPNTGPSCRSMRDNAFTWRSSLGELGRSVNSRSATGLRPHGPFDVLDGTCSKARWHACM